MDVPWWKFASINQKYMYYPDLHSDKSLAWNFFSRSSDIISWEHNWWCHEIFTVFSGYYYGVCFLSQIHDRVCVHVTLSKQQDDQKGQKFFRNITQRNKSRIREAWEMLLPPSFVSWHFRQVKYLQTSQKCIVYRACLAFAVFDKKLISQLKPIMTPVMIVTILWSFQSA